MPDAPAEVCETALDSDVLHQFDPKKRAFLAAYAETGTLRAASRASGVSRRSHHNWIANDAAYAEAVAEARELASDRLEDEARTRAIEGMRRYKFDRNGDPIKHPETGEPYYEHAYSDTLLIFLLKGNNPEKFGDRIEQTHKGEAENPVVIFELPRNGREVESS
ncbi:MAG: terminase [Planctomycetota bacterium]